jgi:hypothetical protein
MIIINITGREWLRLRDTHMRQLIPSSIYYKVQSTGELNGSHECYPLIEGEMLSQYRYKMCGVELDFDEHIQNLRK